MTELEGLSIRYKNHKLSILNQKNLPHIEDWEEISHPYEMIVAIQELKVRGAPLIGVAAALSLAQYAIQGASREEFLLAAEKLRAARPTAVNLMQAIDRICTWENDYCPETIVSKSVQIFFEDVSLCENIAKNGEGLISDGDGILTHCNTGGLATAGVGTALGVIKEAHKSGKKIHVYVDETRPLLQGGRLTTWELEKLKIPYTLICDSMAPILMASGKIQKIFVGADRIAVNGDFANKVGTYGLAVTAHYHKIPFFCVAPHTTIDFDCMTGQEIVIEERRDAEVQGVSGAFGHVVWAPHTSKTFNPAFDVTPFSLVSGWVFDNRVHLRSEIIGERGLCLQL